MNGKALPNWFSSRGTGSEWFELSYLWPARSQRGTLFAIALIGVIAVLDLSVDQFIRNNYSVLYVAPLVLLAFSGGLPSIWRWAALMIVLTFAIHFLKNFLVPPPTGDQTYFDFRLLNRTFTALMFLAVTKMLLLWVRCQADEDDPEVPAVVRAENQRVTSTLAMLCCVPMIVVLAVIDFLVPANVNLAILYPVPLFVAGWVHSCAWLWSIVTALLLLTILAFVVGPAAQVPNLYFGLERQRLLTVAAILVVAIALHGWIGPKAGVRLGT